MSAGTPNPPELVAEVVRLRASGQTYTEIGVRLMIGKNRAAGICHRAKATQPRLVRTSALKRRLRDPAVIARARELWCLGHTFADIAKAVRLPRRSVETMRYRECWPGKLKPRKAAEPERAAVRPQALPQTAPTYTAVSGHAYSADRRCVFPLGEPRTPEFRYCDAAVTTAGPYCAFHRGVCYGKNTAAIMEMPGNGSPAPPREQCDGEDRKTPAADSSAGLGLDQDQHTPAVGRGASRARARLAPAPGAAP
jgi:GcrA cell cycle regulator